jgi:hypothetical protein
MSERVWNRSVARGDESRKARRRSSMASSRLLKLL